MKKLLMFTILSIFISLAFAEDLSENSRADTLATIESFSHLGDFHTINYVGDYEYILDFLDNQFLGGNEQIDEMGCSLFSGLGDSDNIFLGRNFDNPQQDVLVGRYAAPGCYKSIAVNRLADMGLPVGTNFFNLSTQQELLLLRAPYFACDGINEMGLAVGVAYVDVVPVEVDPNKESIWLTRWIREILDHAANVQEAIDITNSYNILDNFYGQNTICHHLLITDSSGSSVILEYHDGAFEEIYPEVDWQVLTNTHIYNHTLQQMFNLCYRYELLYNALEDQEGIIYDWQNGLDILELPTWGNLTNGTQWSSLYDVNEHQFYLSTYRDFNNIARIELDTFEILNFGTFYLEDVAIQDADGDGLIEPNEQVFIIPSVSVDFKSLGVVGNISSDDPDITYINSESVFGDILPEEIVHNAADPFIIQISPNPSNTIFLNFEFTTSYGYSFVTNYPIQISNTNSDDELLNSTDIVLSNYPNPFNPITTISFELNTEITEATELIIYNMKGQIVKKLSCHPEFIEGWNNIIEDAPRPSTELRMTQAGSKRYFVIWNGTDNSNQPVSSGIYYSVLKQNGKTIASKKMMLLK